MKSSSRVLQTYDDKINTEYQTTFVFSPNDRIELDELKITKRRATNSI